MARAKTVTAEEACERLQMAFGNWRARMWAYHLGVPKKRNGKVVKDENGETIRHTGPWMPTPIRGGYSSRKAVFKLADVVYLGREWYGSDWSWDDQGDPVDPQVVALAERLIEACTIFDVPIPENGLDPVDLTAARRTFRQKVATHHPDKWAADPIGERAANAATVLLNGHMQVLIEHNNRIDAMLSAKV